MNELLVEYDDIIIGKRTGFSDTFFNKESSVSSKNALKVIRYAFKRYLRWSKDAIGERMTPELMERLHLQQDQILQVNCKV